MLKVSCAGCPGQYPAISVQFILEMCAAANNCKKTLKTLHYGNSVSFKVIGVDIIKKFVSSACYDKQYVRAHLQLFSR